MQRRPGRGRRKGKLLCMCRHRPPAAYTDGSWVRLLFLYEAGIAVCRSLFVGCLTSQQQASVSQGRICSDNFTCCHTEIEVADQTFYLTQSQYTDTGPTSSSADPITPGASQGSHWSAKSTRGSTHSVSNLPSYRLVGLVVKASASRAEDPGFESQPGSSHTRDSNIGTPVATLPGEGRYRVSTGTGRPGISIL